MRVFIDYFQAFSNTSLPVAEVVAMLPSDYTLKSRTTRTTKARRIFREERQADALAMIAESQDVEIETAEKARQLLAQLMGSLSKETQGGGAGFGASEDNKLVEDAAIGFITAQYEAKGWSVKSVERKKCGYDLKCRKSGDEVHVEVKGVSGIKQSFIITAGEVKRAKTDKMFRLCIVTNALSSSPSTSEYSGKEFLSRFSLEAVQFHASLRLSV